MEIIDGRKIKENILNNIKKEIALLPFLPLFCDVLVGDDPASLQYVKMKAKSAESLGIKFHNICFPNDITTEELVKEINILNSIENMCGIIVQLPLPFSINKRTILDTISKDLDVDCLGSINSNNFYENKANLNKDLIFPTALAIINILDSLNLNYKEKKIVVLGQGELVGKPIAKLLEYRGIECVRVTSNTLNKENILRESDIIISGIGKAHYIKGGMIKEGVILIDAGTSEEDGGIVGDVDLESVKEKVKYISPVPGGVGPVTIAMLFSNVLKVAKNKNNKYE